MFKSVVLALVLFLLVSCSKDPGSSFPLDGAYRGFYFQTDVLSDTATVTLAFAGNGFSGQSIGNDKSICNGNYTVTGDSASFTNLCSNIPSNQLLLFGKYKMTSFGDSLLFTRNTEHFNLKKQ